MIQIKNKINFQVPFVGFSMPIHFIFSNKYNLVERAAVTAVLCRLEGEKVLFSACAPHVDEYVV